MKTEYKIILSCSKLKPTEEDIRFVCENIHRGLDWGEFLYFCVHNRVVSIVYKNLKQLNLLKHVESSVRRIFSCHYDYVKTRNLELYEEIHQINNSFRNKQLTAILLKGSILIPTVYGDYSLREIGDADYLVRVEDLPKISEVLKELGYIQGAYDRKTNTVIPATREEKLTRRMTTHEIVEFIKVPAKMRFWDYYMIDINHSIIWKGDPDSREKNLFNHSELFDNIKLVEIGGSAIYNLPPEYQLIQLCAHLYSEAGSGVVSKPYGDMSFSVL
jgi:hypothetical protein